MSRIFKRDLYTLIQKINNFNTIDFPKTFPNNNKLFVQISMTIEKLFSNNNQQLPDLHRWCNTTSPKYKYKCNWEKKIDNAGRDNCFTNIR